MARSASVGLLSEVGEREAGKDVAGHEGALGQPSQSMVVAA
ncbi:hypothetical protein ACWCXE_14565 [Streptomyces sp. NPDC001780]